LFCFLVIERNATSARRSARKKKPQREGCEPSVPGFNTSVQVALSERQNDAGLFKESRPLDGQPDVMQQLTELVMLNDGPQIVDGGKKFVGFFERDDYELDEGDDGSEHGNTSL
jgi:hypothetical protein